MRGRQRFDLDLDEEAGTRVWEFAWNTRYESSTGEDLGLGLLIAAAVVGTFGVSAFSATFLKGDRGVANVLGPMGLAAVFAAYPLGVGGGILMLVAPPKTIVEVSVRDQTLTPLVRANE